MCGHASLEVLAVLQSRDRGFGGRQRQQVRRSAISDGGAAGPALWQSEIGDVGGAAGLGSGSTVVLGCRQVIFSTYFLHWNVDLRIHLVVNVDLRSGKQICYGQSRSMSSSCWLSQECVLTS